MVNDAVTLFTWGYEGWGNWTHKLVEALDAVEKSREWGPPLLVDIRASRKVRAEGFREHAFEKRFGPDRYLWMNRLGNKAILTGEKYGSLIDPSAAADLLDLAVEMQGKRRRVIYFCSCVSPTNGCHRHWVAPELFKVAKKRDLSVSTVEWPGFESEPGEVLDVSVGPGILAGVNNGTRKSVPLGPDTPAPQLLALPWLTPIRLVDGRSGEYLQGLLTGPAQHRAGGWQLPVVGGSADFKEALRDQARLREALTTLPRSWPSDQPSQVPFKWKSR